MKTFILAALSMGTIGSSFGGVINISTGGAIWQVFVQGVGTITAVSIAPNPAWSQPPTGSSWVSIGPNQGISCIQGQTPGQGCANTSSPNGDIFTYSLNITAASLGATSGTLNFIFGSDNRVNLFAGVNSTAQVFNGGSNTNGNAFNPLGCSGTPTPTIAGNNNPYNCTTSISFNASNLNNDGSLTLFGYDYNDPIPGCPQCGNPTGFILSGTITTGGTSATPEPATFGMAGLASIAAGLALRRKRMGQS